MRVDEDWFCLLNLREIYPGYTESALGAHRGDKPLARVLVINANPDPLHCARELGRLLGDARFQRFIQAEFQPRTTNPHDVLYRIANLPFAHFLTFNFDTSNERVRNAVI
jgi:hypothetical protein